jgi:DNA polymerase-3 subunit epsilon
MTRGQEDLTIDLVDYTVNTDAMGHTKALPSKLKLLKASAEECVSHEKILLEIIKASKKDSVWSPSIQASN